MNPTLVIAEAGVNHNGDIRMAMELVEAAARGGADIVKFQTFQANALATNRADKAAYQKQISELSENQLSMLEKLQLDPQQHRKLTEHCRRHHIEFLSTAFDDPSIDLLVSLGIRRWKIPSGEITNLPYLRRIGAQRQPVILSTGMANLGEIEAALEVLETAGTQLEQITLLHCTTEYPAPLAEVNLRAMQSIAQAFNVAVGYSDHTEGIEIPVAAVALGAQVIEKHLTLDRSLEGPDHRASLEPEPFAAMVRAIRAVELALGDGVKRPTSSELANRPLVRKSLVAARMIQAGECFTADNLTTKRPGSGLSPMHWDAVIGRVAAREYAADEPIEW